MGNIISNIACLLFGKCIKGTEHEIDIAFGRCPTCNGSKNEDMLDKTINKETFKNL